MDIKCSCGKLLPKKENGWINIEGKLKEETKVKQASVFVSFVL